MSYHLLARQLERNGLTVADVSVSDDVLRRIVVDYTREAGVRHLEREPREAVAQDACADRVETVRMPPSRGPVAIDADDVAPVLGRAKFYVEVADRTSVPGVATGLAVTGTGGDVLFIEATAMDGDAGLTLTGQLGDVMKESAQIALSYVQSHTGALGVDPASTRRRVHLHVPAGAIPKDGPSAGVTMTTASVSLLTGRPVRSGVGMTGEVTLQGKVLPIGGVKQKVLAERVVDTVILPAATAPTSTTCRRRCGRSTTFDLADDVTQVLGRSPCCHWCCCRSSSSRPAGSADGWPRSPASRTTSTPR